MPTYAKESAKDFDDLPAGNYQAVCSNVWDIGYQKGEYQGRPTVSHKVIISWEVNERIVSAGEYNGKRYTVNGWYTLSLGKKSNLRRDLTAWRGREFTSEELKGFDVEKLIGANCFLNIVNNKDGKPRVSTVASLPKGMEKITPEAQRTTPEWVKKFQEQALTEDQAAQVFDEIHEMEATQTTEDDTEVPF